MKGYKGQVALFGVQEDLAVLPLKMRGNGADAFGISDARKEENKLLLLEIEFKPTTERGFFAAELLVGQGENLQIVQLRGVATKALEGKNEPPLQELCDALGLELDVGGKQLALDTSKKTIGDSIAVARFEPVGGEAVRLTPLARYSPEGETPFGLAIEEGSELKLRTLASLAASTERRPDAHQTLRPPTTGGEQVVFVKEPPQRFGLFLKAHQYTSLTFPGRATGAPIEHTARIYLVKAYQGQAIANAYVVGFEEAANGDYQDAVFLIEGVKAVK